MPGTFEPYPEIDQFTEDDWLEAVESAPGGTDSFTKRSGSASITVIIPDKKCRSARDFALGYSWADVSTPYKLHRVTPVAHPKWGMQFRAQQVDFSPFAPASNPASPTRSTAVQSPIVPDGIGRYAGYHYSRMTVKFGLEPYYFYEDDDPFWSGKEYDRYCLIGQIEPSLEMLDAQTDRSIFWVDGPTDAPLGKPFPGQVGERVAKTNFQLTWYEVPENYFLDADGIPTKLIRAVGKVNSEPFLGFPKHTLLLNSSRVEKGQFSFYSIDGRAFHYDVTLPLLHFDPDRGYGATLEDRGWRLMPFRNPGSPGSGAPSGGPGWYAVRRAGDVPPTSPADALYIDEIDFATIFDHARQP